MANNNGSNNVRNSKPTTPEEQNAIRRAKKKQQKPGNKQRYTTSSLLKAFNPETFTVRTKAAALLDNPYKEQMIAAFGKFFAKNPEDAFNLIWELTYQHEETKPHLLKILDLSPEMVPDLSLLLVELAAQYRVYVDSSFMLAPSLIGEVKPAFDAIYNENHATALFVHNMCTNYLFTKSSDEINRALALLCSTEENLFFGGILEVIKVVYMPDRNSRYALSAYLKPLHEKIHNLLKAMADAKAAGEKNALGTVSVLANLADACKAAGYKLDDQIPTSAKNTGKSVDTNELPFTVNPYDEEEVTLALSEEPELKTEELQPQSSTEPSVKELTLDNILSNRGDFDGFINQNSAIHLMNLLMHGFQIDQINAKKAIIADILEHHAKMVKAAEALTK